MTAMFTRRDLLSAGAAAALGAACARRAPLLASDPAGDWRRLDAWFDELRSDGLSPCFQVAVSRGSRMVYSHAAGRAAPTADAPPVGRDTLLNVGSVAKPFTAALVLAAGEDCGLRLDDEVRRWLPVHPGAGDTIRGLLTHTAGYTPAQGTPWPAGPEDFETFRARAHEPRDRAFAPGSQASYWSTGYFLLMEVIERATGTSFEDYARARLFDPLGMTRSTFDWRTAERLGRVDPWIAGEQRAQTEVGRLPPFGESGLYTTAEDLLLFCQALARDGELPRGRLFRPETIRMMMEDQTGGLRRTAIFWMKPLEGNPAPFGALNSRDAVGHPGYTGSLLSWDPARRVAIACLTTSLALHGDFTNYARISDRLLESLANA